MLKVDLGLPTPKFLFNGVASDNLSGAAGQHDEKPEWLRRQFDYDAGLAQLFAVEVELEYPEAEKLLRGAQGNPPSD